jgi:hypothetical protein
MAPINVTTLVCISWFKACSYLGYLVFINMCIINGVRYIILELPLNVFNKEQCGEEMHDSRWNLVMGLKLNPSTHVGPWKKQCTKTTINHLDCVT